MDNDIDYRWEYSEAVLLRLNRWVPACGGREVPFHYEGTRWLYVWNPALKKHGYLNLDTDVVYDNYRWDYI